MYRFVYRYKFNDMIYIGDRRSGYTYIDDISAARNARVAQPPSAGEGEGAGGAAGGRKITRFGFIFRQSQTKRLRNNPESPAIVFRHQCS